MDMNINASINSQSSQDAAQNSLGNNRTQETTSESLQNEINEQNDIDDGEPSWSDPSPSCDQSTATRQIKRRARYKSPDRRNMSGSWVFLDSDGNTQQVTQGDLKILLGGQSADSVIAASKAHPLSNDSIDRNTRSETGAKLEPIIQESLILLQRDESIGERAIQRHLSLERKPGNMLMFISQPLITEANVIESEPSVRFINVETERVQLWRHSQDFNRHGQTPVPTFLSPRTLLVTQETLPEETSPVEVEHEIFQMSLQMVPEQIGDQEKVQQHKSPEEGEILLQRELYEMPPSSSNPDKTNTREKPEKMPNAEQDEIFIREWNKSDHCLLSNLTIKCVPSHGHDQTLKELNRDIQDLKSNIFESEQAIKESIAKYVSDKNFEKQLLKAVESYSRTKMESEHKMHILAQEVIDEQLEVLKNQHQYSEASILSLQKRNRYLEDENITLLKKMEKLEQQLFKQKSQPVDVNNSSLTNTTEESTYLLNNKKLRAKLSSTQSQIESMELKLQETQNRANNLAAQVRSFKSELESQKLLKVRSETDHQIEVTALNEELKAKSRLLRDSMEAANILVDDLSVLKSHLNDSATNIHFDWNILYFQRVGSNSLVDLVHMCRGCITELGNALLNSQNQIQDTNMKMMHLSNENCQIQQALDVTIQANNELETILVTSTEEKMASEKLLKSLTQENSNLQEYLSVSALNRTNLEAELVKMKQNDDSGNRENDFEQVEKAIQEIFTSKVTQDLDTQLGKLSQENKELLLELNSAEINFKNLQNIVSNGEKIRMNQEVTVKELQQTIKMLNKEIELLRQSSIAAESEKNIVEKLNKVENDLYKEIAEKVYLTEELQGCKADNAALTETQQSYMTHIHLLQNDLALLTQDTSALKVELENDKRLISWLEYENFNIMSHRDLDNASSNNDLRVMHAALTDNKDLGREFSRVIDENTKQIGKLEKNLDDKNTLVQNLEHEVAHLQALSKYELQDLRSAEEHLKANLDSVQRASQQSHDILVQELKTAQKEMEILKIKLDDANNTANKYKDLNVKLNSKIVIEHQLTEEINTLKKNLAGLQTVTNDRDRLYASQKILKTEIGTLHRSLSRSDTKVDNLKKECKMQAVKNAHLEEKLKHANYTLSQSEGNAETSTQGLRELKMELKEAAEKLLAYEQHISKMDRGIEKHVNKLQQQLKEESQENVKLNKTIHELQNIISNQNGHVEDALRQVNVFKKMEKRFQNIVEDEKQFHLNTITQKQNDLLLKVEFLNDQLSQANAENEALNSEYCQYQEISALKEKKFKMLLEEKSNKRKNIHQELIKIKTEKAALEMELNKLKLNMAKMEEHSRFFEKTASVYETSLHELTEEKRKNDLLEKRIESLEVEAHSMHQGQNKRYLDLETQFKQAKIQLETAMSCLEKERSNNKQEVDQVKKQLEYNMSCLEKERFNKKQEVDQAKKQLEYNMSCLEKDCFNKKQEVDHVKKQLEYNMSCLEKERFNNKQVVDRIKTEHEDERKNFLEQIKNLELRLQHFENLVISKSKALEQLEREHEDISEKLLRAIRMVIDEKSLRQRLESKSNEFPSVISFWEAEKASNSAKLQELIDKVTQVKDVITQSSNAVKSQTDECSDVLAKTKECPSNKSLNQYMPNQTEVHKLLQEINILKEKVSDKDDIIKNYKEQLHSLEERVKRLTAELATTREKLLIQRQELGNSEKTIILLQADKRELSLKLLQTKGMKQEEMQKAITYQPT